MMTTPLAHQSGLRQRVTLGGAAVSALGAVALLGGLYGAGAALILAGIALVAVASPVTAIWAILLLVPFHPIVMRVLQVNGLSGWPFLAVSAWKELALSLALLALVVDRVQRRRAQGVPIGIPMGLGDYLAASLTVLVAVAVVVHPSTLAINGARLMLFPVGMYVAVRLQPLVAERLFLALSVVGATIATFGIVQSTWLGWDFVQRYYVGPGLPIPAIFTAQFLIGPRAAGTFLSPNVFALALAFYVCMATALVLRLGSDKKWRLIPVLALLIVGLVVTFSRSALIGSAIGVGAIVILGVRGHSVQPRKAALVLIATFIPALALSAVVYSDRGGFALLRSTIAAVDGADTVSPPFASPTPSPGPGVSPEPGDAGGESAADSSTTGHIESLIKGWNLVVSHPLGVGLGNVGARPLPGSTERPAYVVESWYLAMGLSLGWLGFVWALLFPAALALAAVRRLKFEKVVLSALVGVGLAAVVAFVSLLLPTMQEPEVAMLPWVVFALIAVRKENRPPRDPADSIELRGSDA